jgi:DegV family protein with EDD domain
MGNQIRIITDSVADLPRAIVDQLGIKVLPAYLVLGENSYLDDDTLDHAWFYDELMRLSEAPRTAAPPPDEFLKAYEELAAEGAEDIIGLFAAAKMSSINNHATIAARQFESARTHIIDTEQVSMGIGWLVISAAEAAARGASVEEVCALVENMRSRSRVLGVLDSLEHLRRSGRVAWAVAGTVNLLQIKPMISFAHSEARLVGRVRTRRRALQNLVDLVREAAPLERLAILHSRPDPDAIADLQAALAPYAPEQPLMVVEIGPVFGTHVGPRCLGVAFVQKDSKTP